MQRKKSPIRDFSLCAADSRVQADCFSLLVALLQKVILGWTPVTPLSLLLNLAGKKKKGLGLKEEQKHTGFTMEPEKESQKNGLIWSNLGEPFHAHSSNASY